MSLLSRDKLLVQCKNTISSRNSKDKNILQILRLLKRFQKKLKVKIYPLNLLIQAFEKLATGAGLLPMVRAGRVHYIPGKIKYTSSTFKSLKWILQEAKNPGKKKFSRRFSLEIKNILQNRGNALTQKKLFIKELRLARLNSRRRRFWNKFLKRKIFRRRKKMVKKKAKKLKKKENSTKRNFLNKKKSARTSRKPRKKKTIPTKILIKKKASNIILMMKKPSNNRLKIKKLNKKKINHLKKKQQTPQKQQSQQFIKKKKTKRKTWRFWKKVRAIRWYHKIYLTYRKYSRKKRKKLKIKRKLSVRHNRPLLQYYSNQWQKKSWTRLQFYEQF